MKEVQTNQCMFLYSFRIIYAVNCGRIKLFVQDPNKNARFVYTIQSYIAVTCFGII